MGERSVVEEGVGEFRAERGVAEEDREEFEVR